MTQDGDGTETVAAAAATAETAASPAETDSGSPTSGEAVVEKSPIDRIEDSFLEKFGMKEETPPPASAPASEATTDEPPASAEGEAATSEETAERHPDAGDAKSRLTEDEWKALPPRAQQRLGYLTDQAKRSKRERDEALGQVEEYREGYEALHSLRSYAAERNMRPEDVTASLNIAGLIQTGKFSEFLTAIKPWYDMAMEATGQALNPEIERMVESGDITREAGLRMTKTEREAKLAQERAQAAHAALEATDEATRSSAHVKSIRDAVIAEEARLRATDPDWAHKAPAIKAQLTEMLQFGARPETPEKAAQMLRSIHARIGAPAKAPPRATNPAPDATSVNRHQAPPKNTLERIEREWDKKFGAGA